MADSIVNARIQLKNDTEAHWSLATNFVPRQGEIIIYNAETNSDNLNARSYPRFKVGDGVTTVNNLPFYSVDLAQQARSVQHTLTFGAGNVYQYDGSADVTVPVYTGTTL